MSRKMDNGRKYKEAEWKWLPTPTALNDLLFCVNLAICLQTKKERKKLNQDKHHTTNSNNSKSRLSPSSSLYRGLSVRWKVASLKQRCWAQSPPMAPMELTVNFFPAFPLRLQLLAGYKSYLACNLWCLDPLEFNKNFMNA